MPQPETYLIPPTAYVPNSPLPVLVYRDVLPGPRTEASVQKFIQGNGWERKVRSALYLRAEPAPQNIHI